VQVARTFGGQIRAFPLQATNLAKGRGGWYHLPIAFPWGPVPSSVRPTVTTILAILGAACAGSPPAANPSPEDRLGTFQFREQVRESIYEIWLAGEFTVTVDTIRVRDSAGECEPLPPQLDDHHSVRCPQGFTLHFPRSNPARDVRFAIMGTRLGRQRVCRRWTNHPTTLYQTCAQWDEETRATRTALTGVLRSVARQ